MVQPGSGWAHRVPTAMVRSTRGVARDTSALTSPAQRREAGGRIFDVSAVRLGRPARRPSRRAAPPTAAGRHRPPPARPLRRRPFLRGSAQRPRTRRAPQPPRPRPARRRRAGPPRPRPQHDVRSGVAPVLDTLRVKLHRTDVSEYVAGGGATDYVPSFSHPQAWAENSADAAPHIRSPLKNPHKRQRPVAPRAPLRPARGDGPVPQTSVVRHQPHRSDDRPSPHGLRRGPRCSAAGDLRLRAARLTAL